MRSSQSKNHHIKIFNELKNSKNFLYKNKDIAKLTGFNESKISRFLGSKRDLPAGEFFYLLECMPKEFQQEFWHKLNLPQAPLHNLSAAIEDMDLDVLITLMQLIAKELERRNII